MSMGGVAVIAKKLRGSVAAISILSQLFRKCHCSCWAQLFHSAWESPAELVAAEDSALPSCKPKPGIS